jgi:hypothetical protein
MKTKFIGHIDNALLNIALCYFFAESPSPRQQRAWDKAQNLSFIGHFKNPFGKFFLVFPLSYTSVYRKIAKHLKLGGGVVGGCYLKFEFLMNIYLKCNNYNKASCD